MKNDFSPAGIANVRARRLLVTDCQGKITAWDAGDRERRATLARTETAAAIFTGDPFTATDSELLAFAALKIRADWMRTAIGRAAYERDVLVLELRSKAEKLFVAVRDVCDPVVEAPSAVQDNWIKALRDDPQAAAAWALDVSEKVLSVVIPPVPAEWRATGEPLKPWHVQYLKEHATPAPAT